MSERETLEVDVLIVGGGVGGLSCGIRLFDRIKQLRQMTPGLKLENPNILIIEKGPEIGNHILSGAVFDPRALNELIPDWAHKGAPITQKVEQEEISFLTKRTKIPLPHAVLPPYLKNDGNYIVSLGEITKWLAGEAQNRDIEILEGLGGSSLLYEGNKVIGVRCGDSGVDSDGNATSNFMPGADIHAKVTVLSEGVRGNLTKELSKKLRLQSDRHPQTYATGIKELWEVPEGAFPAGKILHTLGFPLQSGQQAFGGSFVYGLDKTHVAVGLVVGLDYEDPWLDPHNEFNRFKLHPKIRPILENGKPLAYGAKAIPEGGFYSMPRFYGDGFMIVGDSASFLNAARLKGAHLSMKSGMMAAEAAAEALKCNDFSEKTLGHYEDLFQTSWAKEELFSVRNWRAAFSHGIPAGAIHDVAQRLTGGAGISDPLTVKEDFEMMNVLSLHHKPGKKPERIVPDGKITFDKASDVYHSGTQHEESQPTHLVVEDTDLCVHRCTVEYGNPCQHFCPAGVYEWIEKEKQTQFGSKFGTESKGKLQINFGNCVHCKTCDIKDPYENIMWCVPEGGDGPRYNRL